MYRYDTRKPYIIYNFHDELSSVLNKYEIAFLQNSFFVFNCDEIGSFIDPNRLKAIGER